jgi:hypothetical protein
MFAKALLFTSIWATLQGDWSDPDFPVFVWRVESPGAAIPESQVEAFGGVNVEGADRASWARARGLDFFVGHGPGRNALHIDTDRPWYTAMWERYWEHRDPMDLVRTPCLSEPATKEALRTTLRRTLAARDGDHGHGVSLGDEVGLTPYGAPLDLCSSEACRRGFETFVRESPRWKFLVPEDAPIPYPDTDSTRLKWIENDTSLVPAWLARRAYHHDVVAKVLIDLAEEVRAQQPATPVGLFGQSGRSAFADLGVEQIFGSLDFMEVYRLLDSRELLYTQKRSDQRSFLTLFREEGAPHAPAQLAFEHWMRGGDGLVLWSDQSLAAHTEFTERMTNVVGTVRTLRYQWPEWRPTPDTVAILHSPDSLALSWFRDALHDGPTWMRRFPSYHNDKGTREVSLRALLRALEDCGEMPGALPIDQLRATTGRRFPLVIANHLILVDKEEEDRLRLHLWMGNRLMVVGKFAEFDRRGNRRTDDLFAALQEEYPGTVTRLELDGDRYLEERAQRLRVYATRTRAELRRWLPQIVGPKWALETVSPLYQPPPLPWLKSSQVSSNGASWLCATLPNAVSKEQRAALRDKKVKLVCDPGWTVNWIHPPQAIASATGEFVLPAGEAAVFRLNKVPRLEPNEGQ